MPGTLVLLLPVLSLATSAAADQPRLTPPPLGPDAVDVDVNDASPSGVLRPRSMETDQGTRPQTSDVPTVPRMPEPPPQRFWYDVPDAPIEHQVAVVQVLKTCFIVAAFAIMAVFGCWKLVAFRNSRRERLLRRAASAGETGSPSVHYGDKDGITGRPSPRNIDTASKWLTGLAQDTDQFEDQGKAETETRDTSG